ncbi:MAG: hypothetical protein GTO22_14460 [Gemmatimonadales bacterium]|nr:hypothetical protein [Gemmatimonadales bacterium]
MATRKAKTAAEAQSAREKKAQALDDEVRELGEQLSETKPDTMNESIVLAQHLARHVVKRSKNQHHQYEYASTEDVIRECNHALSAAGLAFLPVEYRIDRSTEPATLHANYVLLHWKDTRSMAFSSQTSILPGKGRPEDKAEATAKTYDLGYTLRGLLLLPRVDKGTEVDQRDDGGYEPTPNEWAKRKTAATSRLSEIKRMKGEDWCRVTAGSRPKKTVQDLEELVRHFEFNLAKSLEDPKGKPVATMETTDVWSPSKAMVEDFWRVAEQAGYTDEDVSSDLASVYGAADPSKLSQDDFEAALRRYKGATA